MRIDKFIQILLVTGVLGVSAHAQGIAALDTIIAAHGVKGLASTSVVMIGSVQRGDAKPEPFRIVATRDEELRIEYGSQAQDTLVASQKMNFHDDGKKIEYSRVPSGFSQLDVTGLFLIEQFRNRAVQVDQAKEPVTLLGVPTTQLRVQSERTQTHKGSVTVSDRADVYVDKNGILTAISRSFYDGRPDRYTQMFFFSDYRKTGNEGVLVPYRVQLFVKGHLRQTYQIETYQFDVPTDRDLFTSRRTQ